MMATHRITAALVTVAATALVLALAGSRSDTPLPDADPAPGAARQVRADPPPAMRAEVPPRAAPRDEEPMLRMPDGSRVALLNGVESAPKLVWGDRPWSPIVGKETSGGIDWYVHEDGSKTTTMMVWREDLGRMDAMSMSAHPEALAEVDGG